MSLGAPNVVNSDVRVYCRVLFDSDKAHVPSCLVRYLDAELTVIVDEQHFARILVAQRGYGNLCAVDIRVRFANALVHVYLLG